LEMRVKELEQSNEGLRLQFKYLEKMIGEREEETKANINNLGEKVREREEVTKGIIKNLEEKVKEEAKAKQKKGLENEKKNPKKNKKLLMN
ncbi:8948_t:CDS:2, partial [Funneliformis mosseae]